MSGIVSLVEQGQSPGSGSTEQRIDLPGDGSRERFGQVLQACRQYLLLVARRELDTELRGKIGVSDIVQETFLEAQRDFARFRGRSERELIGWLRRILLNNLANAARHYRKTRKREVGREVDAGSTTLRNLLDNVAADTPSPSQRAIAAERDRALLEAVQQLPQPARQVIQWRNYERCSFQEIGRRLGRSAEAARKIWSRALDQLGEWLDPPSVTITNHK